MRRRLMCGHVMLLLLFGAMLLITQVVSSTPSLWLSAPVAGLTGRPLDTTTGHVTVVSLLSASFSYSRRHAVALDRLRQRLLDEGLPVLMLGVNAHNRASQLMVSQFDLLLNFSVYQATHDNQLWSRLGGTKDDVFVYDDCGRLTYYLPFPHSFVPSRFVELAVYSTHEHLLCRPKNETGNTVNVKPLREPSSRSDSRRRSSAEQRKCSCLPGSGQTSGEQHCLCRQRHGMYSTSEPSTQDTCFCKWRSFDVEQKCRCHGAHNAEMRNCDCRIGFADHALTDQTCYCQASPVPYGRFAPVARENLFCTRHVQPLLWQDALRMWRWPTEGGHLSNGNSDTQVEEWLWEGAPGDASGWRWSHQSSSWLWQNSLSSWTWSEDMAASWRQQVGGWRWYWAESLKWNGEEWNPTNWQWSSGNDVQWRGNRWDSRWQWVSGNGNDWSGSEWNSRIWHWSAQEMNKWNGQKWELSGWQWSSEGMNKWSGNEWNTQTSWRWSIAEENSDWMWVSRDWLRNIWSSGDICAWSSQPGIWFSGATSEWSSRTWAGVQCNGQQWSSDSWLSVWRSTSRQWLGGRWPEDFSGNRTERSRRDTALRPPYRRRQDPGGWPAPRR